ncbi:Uncharacterized protein APZ42_022121 [Daphnia magna]|uniref:Uncharacterized protein n=1 Tax=Daphnia magna TaxID=35525 RepID=A0A164W110_9CRUS|nr:Uncharacterized protein APZ42_022121 [Daphnia magna]
MLGRMRIVISDLKGTYNFFLQPFFSCRILTAYSDLKDKSNTICPLWHKQLFSTFKMLAQKANDRFQTKPDIISFLCDFIESSSKTRVDNLWS